MTDRIKITDLETLEDIADGDWVPVVDIDDTTDSEFGTTKKVRKSKLKGLNWQGPWSAGAYETDDAVEHEGSAWMANTDTTQEPSDVASDWDLLAQKGDKGDQGDQGTQGMVWMGPWSAGTFAEDDVVEHEGSCYIALTTTTEEPSLSATDWDLVAQKGDQGDKGNQWQGPWSAGTYQIDDVVEHNGSSWIAIAVTTQEPTNIASEWNLFAKAGEDGEGSGDMLKANYDPTNVNADAFAMDNMAEGADTKILTAAERTKLGHILVTQSVDLDQMEADIAALANGMVYKGNWAANAGTFPGAGVAQTGWFYTVSVAGTVDGVVFNVGDRLIAVVDNASATVYASNWTQLDATDAVTSVASLTGNISAAALLTALALDDVIKTTDTSTAGFGFVLDEDDMASNSATKVPSQQSVKAYVDGKPTVETVTDTAAIALSAGDPVGMTIEGKVAKAFRNWIAPNTSPASSVRLLEIDTNKFVVGFLTVPLTYAFNVVCGSYDPATDTVTFGSTLTQTGLVSGGFDFCKLDTNKFVIVNARDSNSDAYTSICTVSGTTITQAASQTLLVAGSFDKGRCCQLDTDKFAVIYAAAGATTNYQAVCTVSGTTVSVLYSSTSVIANINVTNAIYRLCKLTSTKHVILNGNTGYCVVIDSSSAYTAGTAVQPVVAATPGHEKTSIISESATSFIMRVGGGMRKCSVSGTTISNDGAAVSITNDGGGDLCIYNSAVYEAFYDSTTATLRGIYLITHSTNLIRTQIVNVPFTGSVFIGNVGSAFIVYQSGSNYFTSKMASNFAGFLKAGAAQDASVTIYPSGVVTGLSGILEGARYGVSGGAFVLDPTGTHIGISTTSILVR